MDQGVPHTKVADMTSCSVRLAQEIYHKTFHTAPAGRAPNMEHVKRWRMQYHELGGIKARNKVIGMQSKFVHHDRYRLLICYLGLTTYKIVQIWSNTRKLTTKLFYLAAGKNLAWDFTITIVISPFQLTMNFLSVIQTGKYFMWHMLQTSLITCSTTDCTLGTILQGVCYMDHSIYSLEKSTKADR